MHFAHVLSAAMLLTLVSATPVQKAHAPEQIEQSKRQLSGLTGILKGIMDSSSNSGGSNPNTVTTSAASTDTIALQQCSDAISKIEATLSISAKYMTAADGTPTPQEILAILIVLEQSLGADCGGGFERRDGYDGLSERSKRPLAGILGDENRNGSPFGTGILGGGNGDEHQVEACDGGMYCEDSQAREMEKKSLDPRSSCSDCEFQLYNIVRELQVIFALGVESAPDLPALSSSVAAVATASLSASLAELTNPPVVLTATSSSLVTGIPRQ